MRMINRAVPDLSDQHAMLVREALMASVLSAPVEPNAPLTSVELDSDEPIADDVGVTRPHGRPCAQDEALLDPTPTTVASVVGTDSAFGDGDRAAIALCANGDRPEVGVGANGDGGAQIEAHSDPRALLVLLGAASTRLRASRLRSPSEQQLLAVEAIQLYAPLAHAVGFGGAFAELEALAYQRLFPDSLRRLQRWFGIVWPDAQRLVSALCAGLEASIHSAPALHGLLSRVSVSGRVKTLPSTFRKVLREQTDVDSIKDIVALRCVLTPAADATEVLGALMKRQVTDEEVEALVCHVAYKQVVSLWAEMPGRYKNDPRRHHRQSPGPMPILNPLAGTRIL